MGINVARTLWELEEGSVEEAVALSQVLPAE